MKLSSQSLLLVPLTAVIERRASVPMGGKCALVHHCCSFDCSQSFLRLFHASTLLNLNKCASHLFIDLHFSVSTCPICHWFPISTHLCVYSNLPTLRARDCIFLAVAALKPLAFAALNTSNISAVCHRLSSPADPCLWSAWRLAAVWMCARIDAVIWPLCTGLPCY